jgi:hypothetical protein
MLGLRGLTSDPPKKKRKRERQPSANDPFFLSFFKKIELMKRHLFKFFNKNRRRINYIGK